MTGDNLLLLSEPLMRIDSGSDVVVGSPLELVSLSEGVGASISEDAPLFRLYYQSINGAIKEMQDNGSQQSWQPGR